MIVDPSKVFYDPNTEPHYHFYNSDTGELTDIEAACIEVSGLPRLPEGMVTDGVDIIDPEPEHAALDLAATLAGYQPSALARVKRVAAAATDLVAALAEERQRNREGWRGSIVGLER